jgi:hypothetical protein
VLAAHAQGSYNRLRRQLGDRGALLLSLYVGGLGLAVVVPVLVGSSVAAYFTAREAFDPHGTPSLAHALGAALTFLSLGGGFIGGVAGGAKQLTWESYRGFPLQPRTLFAAELLAGLGDLITAAFVAVTFGVCGATVLAAPKLLVGMFVLGVETVLLLLSVQLLVGSLAERLVKRLRLALAVAFGLAWAMSSLATPTLEHAKPGDLRALQAGLDALLVLAAKLPASLAIQSVRDGTWGGLLLHTGLLAATLLGSFTLLWRERESAADETSAPPDKLWSFTRPVLGVARLQLDTLLGSHLGKAAFVMPLVTVVLIRGPLATLTSHGAWMLPSAFIYASLGGINLGFNQFGLDGHGVKAFFLLPIDEETLLQGKQLGFAAWQAVQLVLLVALLGLALSPSPAQLIGGAELFIGLFFVQSTVGQRTSIWMPRKMQRASMKNGQMPLPVVLVGMATTLVSSSVFGGTYWGLYSLGGGWLLVPGMAVLAVMAAVASRPLLKWNAKYLANHRDKLVSVVG